MKPMILFKDGGSNSPAPIDVNQSIRTQAEANRVNLFSPQGSAQYSGPNKSDLTISLSPRGQETQAYQEELQRALAQRGLGAAGALPTTPLSFSNLPDIPTGVDMSGLNGDQLEQATFQRGQNLLQPGFDRSRSRLGADLQARGIPMGSEAYNDAYSQISEQERPLLENLALSSVGAGRQEQSRLFDLGSRNAQMGLQARQQGVAENTALRAQPFNELSFYMGGGAPTAPQFLPPNAVDVTGPTQANYAGQLNASNQAAQSQQGLYGGLFGLGSAALLGGLKF